MADLNGEQMRNVIEFVIFFFFTMLINGVERVERRRGPRPLNIQQLLDIYRVFIYFMYIVLYRGKEEQAELRFAELTFIENSTTIRPAETKVSRQRRLKLELENLISLMAC